MCGGIGFKVKDVYRTDLMELVERGPDQGENTLGFSAFWQERPILPIVENQRVKLYDWGNRDAQIDLPKTGWAKEESLTQGRWCWFKPIPVIIPAVMGYEKGVWFLIDGGIRALLIQSGQESRAYMITKPASAAYAKLTNHDRMPLLVKGEKALTPLTRTGTFKIKPLR